MFARPSSLTFHKKAEDMKFDSALVVRLLADQDMASSLLDALYTVSPERGYSCAQGGGL
jgi:hypothetical protein